MIMVAVSWDVMPYSPLQANRRFGGTCLFHLHGYLLPAFTQVSVSTYTSTLKIQTICSSEEKVDIESITGRHIREDNILLNKR